MKKEHLYQGEFEWVYLYKNCKHCKGSGCVIETKCETFLEGHGMIKCSRYDAGTRKQENSIMCPFCKGEKRIKTDMCINITELFA